jgi:hypothetical protein
VKPLKAERPPLAEQINAYQYLLDHQDEIRDASLAAIFEEYPRIRQRLLEQGFLDESEVQVLNRPSDLKSHIGLATVHLLRVVRDGAAYIGFEFGCTWDEEHGLGVMIHQGRIVEIPAMGIGKVSGADLASEDWLAEADADNSKLDEVLHQFGRSS